VGHDAEGPLTVRGAPVKRSRRGGFDLRIPSAEREVLGTIPQMLRALLVDGDANDPALQRLYPKAFIDDEDAEFHDITHDELLQQRLEAIDTMERTVRSDHVTEDELLAWLAALNDVRLVIGVRLAVTEEATAADFAGDPETGRAYELYRYLSSLEEHVVDALSS
jgi:hypothetical protein